MNPAMKERHYEEPKKELLMLRYGMKPGQEDSDDLDSVDRKGLLSISELAKFARTSRTALIFYDNMGLVSPVERGDNNYRYYSPFQVTTTNLINTLQELAVPLKEIIGLTNHRTPEKIISLFSEQSKQIDQQIQELIRAQKLLLTLKGVIEEGVAADENKIEVKWHEEEAILLGPENDYSKGVNIEKAISDFYKHFSETDEDMDLNYPAWAIYSLERVKRGELRGPDRFYFKTPDGPDRKPAGLYATGYTRGYYGQNEDVYKKILAFIKENGYEMCGPSYEAYPLNEISIQNPYDYLMRVSVNVKKL